MYEKYNKNYCQYSTKYKFSDLQFFFIGAAIVLFGAPSNKNLDPIASESKTNLVLLLGLPWVSLAGIVVIVRKEVPRIGMSSIKGNWAVLQGVLLLIITTSAWVALVYNIITSS